MAGSNVVRRSALRQLRLMKLFPVDSVARGTGVFWDSIGAENRFARRVIVNIAADGGIQLFHRALVEFHSGLLFDPSLELRISRPRSLEEIDGRIAGQPDPVNHHLIVAGAAAWIPGGQLATGFERELEPQPRQVHNTERPGYTRTNQGNSRIHNFVVWFLSNEAQRKKKPPARSTLNYPKKLAGEEALKDVHSAN